MPFAAFGPHFRNEESDSGEDTLVKTAIDRATDKCSENETLMTQLCRISAQVDTANKSGKDKKRQQ